MVGCLISGHSPRLEDDSGTPTNHTTLGLVELEQNADGKKTVRDSLQP